MSRENVADAGSLTTRNTVRNRARRDSLRRAQMPGLRRPSTGARWRNALARWRAGGDVFGWSGRDTGGWTSGDAFGRSDRNT
jgi:hypothetical protein